MSKELAKTYDPKGLEDRLYQKWLDKKYFHAEVNPEQEAVYHRDPAAKRHRTAAYGTCAGQDDAGYSDPVSRRMQGYEALWQPGTDHAAIATEVKVTAKLQRAGH